MRRATRPSRRGPPVVLSLVAALATGPPAALASGGDRPAPAAGGARAAHELPLGPSGLPERRTRTAVAPGITWTRIVRGGRSGHAGPWLVNVLAVDRPRLAGRLSAALANDRVAGRETVRSMARRTRALAGVNGDFFVSSGAGDGDPVGALSLRGRLVSEATDGRTALLVPRSPLERAALAPLWFEGGVELGGRRRLLDGVDRVRGAVPNCGGRGGDRPTERPRLGGFCTDPSELVMLSPRFGRRTPRLRGGVEAVVRRGAVTSVRRGSGTPIPADGYVLSGSGDAARFLRAAARPGSRPQVTTALRSRHRLLSLPDYEAIVSGGPRLVTSGRVRVRSAAEGFGWKREQHGRFVAGRNPRTMAGVAPDGRVLLVTVDGRRPRVSVGVTLAEGARVMRALGARDAMNLDGGGSTTMVVGGRVVNRPSDRTGERAVAEGILVLP